MRHSSTELTGTKRKLATVMHEVSLAKGATTVTVPVPPECKTKTCEVTLAWKLS